jgi:superfamily II DNA or RNA helicase
MDLESLYQDLFSKYASTSKHADYQEDAQKVSEYLARNKDVLTKHIDNLYLEEEQAVYTSYPEYEDKQFNEKIFRKKEFNRSFHNVALNATHSADFDSISQSKCSQTSFRLTPNQKFIKNFMSPLTPYHGLLLFHSVGVGKTCTAISIAEQYHQLYQKPVLVILSPTLIDNFKKQLFDITKYNMVTNESNLCTGTSYPDLILDKSLMKPETLEKSIHRIINQRYKFMGYKKLVSIFEQTKERVKKQEKDVSKHEKMFYDKIKEFFSNRLVIVDEAHNLRNASEKGNKQTAQAFRNLLQYTENVKLVLLTATPMFNNANEIVWLMNLLLTNDKRQNIRMTDIFDKMGVLTSQGRKKLLEVARGYVSYMRGENPFTFPFRLYPSINKDTNVIMKYPSLDISNKAIKEEDKVRFLELVGSPMSPYQKRIYDFYKKKVFSALTDDIEGNDEDTTETDDDKIPNDLQSIFQVSNIVYPIESFDDPSDIARSFGNSGFANIFINTAKKGVRYKYSPQCISKYGEILAYNNLATYAPKIKSIIDYVISSEGIVFVYSNYYGAGIKPLAIALEHCGFTKYNANNITGDHITVDKRFKDSKYVKQPSYVILSRNADLSPNNDKEIDMVKSKQNSNGEIIKVVIASQIATEGIDFKRMREVHILEPWYNLNKCEQIVGRAVRTCSHIDLPKEQRNVTIYYHVAQYSNKEESIDIRKYRVAEKKQKRITEIEKLLKESSIDCNLNKSSLIYNVDDLNMDIPLRTSQGTQIAKYRVGDRDNTYVCNYGKCEVKCEPELAASVIDTSTFDNRFIMDDVSLYQRYIALLYKQRRKAFTYTQILKSLRAQYSLVDEEVLQYALQAMLDDKVTIVDEHGIRGYLMYRSDKYIFQNSIAIDKRMTIEQRETPPEVQNRLALNVSALKHKPQHQQQMQNVNANVKNSVFSVNGSVIMYIAEHYNDIKHSYTNQGVNISKYDKYIIDSIIDKLSPQSYVRLVEELATLYNADKLQDSVAKECLRSLIEAGVIVFTNNRLTHLYHYTDSEIYCLRSDHQFKKCSPLELNQISNKIPELRAKMSNNLEDSIKGHIDAQHFKVRDNPKSSGYVCLKTSSLSLADLRDRIATLDSKMSLGNMIKKDMCFLYELTLRAQGKSVFKRAITKKKV